MTEKQLNEAIDRQCPVIVMTLCGPLEYTRVLRVIHQRCPLTFGKYELCAELESKKHPGLKRCIYPAEKISLKEQDNG